MCGVAMAVDCTSCRHGIQPRRRRPAQAPTWLERQRNWRMTLEGSTGARHRAVFSTRHSAGPLSAARPADGAPQHGFNRRSPKRTTMKTVPLEANPDLQYPFDAAPGRQRPVEHFVQCLSLGARTSCQAPHLGPHRLSCGRIAPAVSPRGYSSTNACHSGICPTARCLTGIFRCPVRGAACVMLPAPPPGCSA